MSGSWYSASGGLGKLDGSKSASEQLVDMQLCTQHTNMQDVKELIPEFYYLPDFLTNLNSYDLGQSASSGKRYAMFLFYMQSFVNVYLF